MKTIRVRATCVRSAKMGHSIIRCDTIGISLRCGTGWLSSGSPLKILVDPLISPQSYNRLWNGPFPDVREDLSLDLTQNDSPEAGCYKTSPDRDAGVLSSDQGSRFAQREQESARPSR